MSKKLSLLTLLFLAFFQLMDAQDKVLFLSGDSIEVNIVKVLPDTLVYELMTDILDLHKAKVDIEKIYYRDGKIEICTEVKKYPEVRGLDDWRKVIITLDKKDIKELIEVSEVKGFSKRLVLNAEDGGKEARKALRKDAAALGACMILLTEGWDYEKKKPEYKYGKGVKLYGIAYKEE